MQSPSLSPSTHPVLETTIYSTMFLSHLFNTPRRWVMMMGQQQSSSYNGTLSDFHTTTTGSTSTTITPTTTTVMYMYDTWQWMISIITMNDHSKDMFGAAPNSNTINDETNEYHITTTLLYMIVALLLAVGFHTIIMTTMMMTLSIRKLRTGCTSSSSPCIIKEDNNENNVSSIQSSLSLSSNIGDGTAILRNGHHNHHHHHHCSTSDVILPPSTTSTTTATSTNIFSNVTFSFSFLLYIQKVISSIVSILWNSLLVSNLYIAIRVYIGFLMMGLLLPVDHHPERGESSTGIVSFHILPSSSFVTSILHSIITTTTTTNSKNNNTTSVSSSNTSTSTTDPGGGGCSSRNSDNDTVTSSFSGTTTATTFRFYAAAPMVALIVWIALTIITIKRQILLQQQQQPLPPTPVSQSSNNNNNHNNNNNNHKNIDDSNNSGTTELLTTASGATTTTTTTTTISKMSGRMILLNRIIDIFIYMCMIVYIIHEIAIDTTASHFIVQSLLSAGGIGALIFSLASKDLAVEIVGGMTLGMYDIFHVGDRIRVNESNLSGKIIEIGFVETIIQSYDNIITRVPNSQLTKSRISNLSRCPRSRLRQNIRIKYSDIDKLPALLIDIKEEIILSCPKVISDGSKSFHTVVSSFEADHIQVMILAHFDIPPVTAEYIRNRHDVLFAIHRAMKKHHVDFAIPPIVYSNTHSPTNGKEPADYSF